MTLTAPTSLDSGGLSANASSYVTNSISPAANRLCLIAVSSQGNGVLGAIPTVTGAGLTWVQVHTFPSTDNLRRVTVLRAMGSSPSSGALTIDFGGALQLRACYSVAQWGSDVDTSGTNGSGAIVQSTDNLTTSTPVTFTVTLAAFGNAGNGCYGVMCLNSQGQTITAGTNFTKIDDNSAGAEALQMCTEYYGANDTTVDWSTGGGASTAFGIAIEIKAAATGAAITAAVMTASALMPNAAFNTGSAITAAVMAASARMIDASFFGEVIPVISYLKGDYVLVDTLKGDVR
jgi:hypothetical protein